MSAKHIGLGRGLGALIKDTEPASPAAPAAAATGGLVRLPLDAVRKNPWQPRQTFAPEALEDLTASVRERGVIQPLLVRRAGPGYELLAGERRLMAARAAGLSDVPVIIIEATDHDALVIALIENLQREDLNLIEQAEGFRALADKFGLTQEQIAQRVGKARATVANVLRLLELPPTVRRHAAEGRLSAGHAKVLLGLSIAREQELLADRCVQEGLSVRTLERIARRLARGPRKPRAARADVPESHVQYVTERLRQHLGTSVRVFPSRTLANGKKAKGRVEIDLYTNDDLDRLLEKLGLAGDL